MNRRDYIEGKPRKRLFKGEDSLLYISCPICWTLHDESGCPCEGNEAHNETIRRFQGPITTGLD